MRGEVAAVSCPSCGAGLKALGGGRVVLHVCSHCGAELDAVENYRLLRTHAGRNRPDTPFQLGAKGIIKGVSWTVIGIISWAETHYSQSWGWTDHQLYSPTHGYAWLTLEDGFLIFTRAWRGPLNPSWITPEAVEFADSHPEIYARDRSYAYYETADATVNFAEGEFSSVIRMGDRVNSLCFLSPDELMTLTQSGNEREVELSTWLPQAEIWAAFALSPPVRPWRVHPLQPYQPFRDEGFVTRLGMATCVAAVLLSLSLMTRGEPVSPVLEPGGPSLALDAEVPITATRGLTEFQIVTDLYNAWSDIDLELVDPAGAPVFEAEREIGYYEGVEDGESWSEGSNTLTVAFRPPVAGDYSVSLDVSEGGTGETAEGSPIRMLRLAVVQGKAASFWMWLVVLITLPIAAATPVRRWLHHKARWRGSDWSDE